MDDWTTADSAQGNPPPDGIGVILNHGAHSPPELTKWASLADSPCECDTNDTFFMNLSQNGNFKDCFGEGKEQDDL